MHLRELRKKRQQMIPLWPWSVSPLDQTSFSRSGLALHNCSKPTEHKGRCPLGLLEHLKKASNLHISYCWGSYHQPPSQSHPTCRWQHPSRAVLEGLGFVWGGEVKNDQEEALKYKQCVSVLAQSMPIYNSGTGLALSFLTPKTSVWHTDMLPPCGCFL